MNVAMFSSAGGFAGVPEVPLLAFPFEGASVDGHNGARNDVDLAFFGECLIPGHVVIRCFGNHWRSARPQAPSLTNDILGGLPAKHPEKPRL